MKAKTMKKLMPLLAVTISAAAVAADRTVAEVDTLTANASYGQLVVNADLTIGEGVTVECTSLRIADGIQGQSATLTLEKDAVLNVTGTDPVQLGSGGGEAHLVMKTGSSLTADSMNGAAGYASTPASTAVPTRSFVVVSNATITLNGTVLTGKNYNGLTFPTIGNWPSGTDKSEVVDEIRLDSGSALYLRNIIKDSSRAAKIVFNGGKVYSNGQRGTQGGPFISSTGNSKGSPLYIESINSQPIWIECSHANISWHCSKVSGNEVLI